MRGMLWSDTDAWFWEMVVSGEEVVKNSLTGGSTGTTAIYKPNTFNKLCTSILEQWKKQLEINVSQNISGDSACYRNAFAKYWVASTF